MREGTPIRLWTGEDVQARLVDEFRRMPGLPIWSPRKSVFLTIDETSKIETLDLVAASAHFLGGRESRDRKMLLTWASGIANRAAIAAGERDSLRTICRKNDWRWSTFNARVPIVAQQLADAINSHVAG